MELFSTDADLLVFEPGLFTEILFAGQLLIKGTNGIVSGTSFSATDVNFIDRGITAGGVIFLQSLDGVINAAYEIVSVDSETQMTISTVRTDAEQTPKITGTASDVIFYVVTYTPQAARALIEITGRLGLRPGSADAEYGLEDIRDTESLRAPSVYRVLAMVFGTLGGTEDAKQTYAQKRDYYMALYKEAFGRVRVALDPEGDGVVEKVIVGGSVRTVRE